MIDRRRVLVGGGASLATFAATPPLCAVVVFQNRVSVRDHGARGDGNNDDTVAINDALARCAPGDTLYFPSGTYVVSVTDGNEQSIHAIPHGVNVLMDVDAWIWPSTRNTIISVFMPLGNNRLQVNIDGRSLPTGATVEGGTWRNNSHGIRAYGNARYGRGARNVRVERSQFRNLRLAIQTEGAHRWTIRDCHFQRTMLSAVLLGYSDGADCTEVDVSNNRFEELGDTAIALYELEGTTRGQGAYLTMADNYAKDYCLRTAGFAFDVEEGTAERQHHIVMSNNTAEHTRSDLPHFVGGFTMGRVESGAMRGNVARGAGNSEADVGFNMLGCRNGLITQNRAEGWRGGGINTDGSSAVRVLDNDVVDCGGTNANTPSIRIAFVFSTRDITVSNNRVQTRRGYRFAGAGAIAIGAVARSERTRIDRIVIEANSISAPLDVGVAVYGTDQTPATNATVAENRISGGVPGLFGSWGVQLSRVAGGTVRENVIENCRLGIAAQRSRRISIEANDFGGSAPVETAFDVTGSSDITIARNRAFVSVRAGIEGRDLPTSSLELHAEPSS